MFYSQTVQKEQLSTAISSSISDMYYRWFDIITANTTALREKAYRLRYQVYCCEHQYETPDEHPQHMETDIFDDRSVHSLIVDRYNGLAIGTVRLILPPTAFHEAKLPFQHVCKHPLPIDLSLSGAAEISRFAISKELRKMVEGYSSMNVKCSIVLGLMKAIVQTSLAYDIKDWLAVMEPALLRLLCRFGIYFAPIGPLIEYHGFRQPCHANVEEMMERVHQENYDLWEFVTEANVPWFARKALQEMRN
jgi:N-acyl amino acid synthase of PEP-CTERM/exosortase system